MTIAAGGLVEHSGYDGSLPLPGLNLDVAGSLTIHAGGEKFFDKRFCHSASAGDVFGVGDNEVERHFIAQPGEQHLHGHPAGLSDNVTDNENFKRQNRFLLSKNNTASKLAG